MYTLTILWLKWRGPHLYKGHYWAYWGVITPETLIHTGKTKTAVEKRDTVMQVKGKARCVLPLASFTVLNRPTDSCPPVLQCARVWGRPQQQEKFSSEVSSSSDCWLMVKWLLLALLGCSDSKTGHMASIRTSIWWKLQAKQSSFSEEMNMNVVQ